MQSNLTVTGLKDNIIYGCVASNKAGTSEKKTCEVTVIKKGITYNFIINRVKVSLCRSEKDHE